MLIKISIFFCSLLIYFPANAQNNILVKTKEKKIKIKKGSEGNNFYINLTIQNNTNDTLSVPPKNSNINYVLIEIPPHDENYLINKIAIDEIAPPRKQILPPKISAKIRVFVLGSIFLKKGRNKVRFYPVITSLKNDKKIRARSNKVIVKVE